MTEVSLALLVIAIGLMAVIGLFPAGLDQGRKAIEETQAMFFADSVFASLKGAQMYVPWDVLPTDQYEHIPPNTISDNGGANPWQEVMWHNAADMTIIADGEIYPMVFDARLIGSNDSMRDHALSFRLRLLDQSDDPGLPDRIYKVSLEVWNNEFAADITPEPKADHVFYTELFNYGYVVTNAL